MSIRSGIGIGEAQIYDISGIEKGYYNLLKQKELRDAKFVDDMATTLAKYSSKGLNPKDIELQNKAYEDLRKLATSASTGSRAQQNEAKIAVLAGMNQIAEYNQRAIEAKKNLDAVVASAQEKPWMYKDDIVGISNKLYQTPYSEWGNYSTIDNSTFERALDMSSLDKVFDGVNKALAETAKKTGKPIYNGDRIIYQVPKESANGLLSAEILLSPEANYTLRKSYSVLNPGKQATDADLINFANEMYQKKQGENAFSFYGGARNKSGGLTESEKKQQISVSDRTKILDNLMNGVPGSDKEFLNVSSLPYGTDVKFLDVKRKSDGTLVKKLFKVVIPKSEWENVVSSNPNQRYSFGSSSEDGKNKIFEFDLSSPDARRGLNVFINQFSGGKNVDYRDVKGGSTNTAPKPEPTQKPTQKPTTKKYTPTQEKAIARGIKDNPGATREQIIQALGL